eukprot:6429656-Pyramimonas_sp.AAC.1
MRELGRAGADDAEIHAKQKRVLDVIFPGIMNAMGLEAAIDDAQGQGRAPADPARAPEPAPQRPSAIPAPPLQGGQGGSGAA